MGLELRGEMEKRLQSDLRNQCYKDQGGGPGSRENHQALQDPQLHGEE